MSRHLFGVARALQWSQAAGRAHASALCGFSVQPVAGAPFGYASVAVQRSAFGDTSRTFGYITSSCSRDDSNRESNSGSGPPDSQGSSKGGDGFTPDMLARWRMMTSRLYGWPLNHVLLTRLQQPHLISWYRLYPGAKPISLLEGPFESLETSLFGKMSDLSPPMQMLAKAFKLRPLRCGQEEYAVDVFKNSVDKACTTTLGQVSKYTTLMASPLLSGSSQEAIQWLKAANEDLRSDSDIERFKQGIGDAVAVVLELYAKGNWAAEGLQPMVSAEMLQCMEVTHIEQTTHPEYLDDVIIQDVEVDIEQLDIVGARSITSKQLAAFDKERASAQLEGSSRYGAIPMWDVVHVNVKVNWHATMKVDDRSPLYIGGRWSHKVPQRMEGTWVFCRGPVQHDKVVPADVPWFVLAWM